VSCAAPFPDVEVHAFDAAFVPGPLCAAGKLELAAGAATVLPDEALSTTVDLTRARLSAGVAAGPAWGRVRVLATRSADEDSYLGVEGEAWIPVIDRASLGASGWGFSGELGLVADPWVAAGSRTQALDAVARPMADELGWIARSDAGLLLGWRGLGDRVSITGSLVTGEGANRRERNEGKDLLGQLSVAPLGTDALVVSVYGRNGSRGIGYVPAHRVGLRLAGEVERLGWGVEGMAVWGVGDDATRSPSGASGWVQSRPIGPLLVAARGDVWSEDLTRDDAFAWRVLGGAGAAFDLPGGTLSALLGADHLTRGDAVTPFAGAPAGASSTTLYLHVELELAVRTETP
jgi:hypothetical protein